MGRMGGGILGSLRIDALVDSLRRWLPVGVVGYSFHGADNEILDTECSADLPKKMIQSGAIVGSSTDDSFLIEAGSPYLPILHELERLGFATSVSSSEGNALAKLQSSLLQRFVERIAKLNEM